MEEGSWERFMSTGKIEDYLKFKSCFPKDNINFSSKKEGGILKEEKRPGKREQLRAGYSESNRPSS